MMKRIQGENLSAHFIIQLNDIRFLISKLKPYELTRKRP